MRSIFKIYKSTLLACGCRIQFQVGRSDGWEDSSMIIYHNINLPDKHKDMVRKLLDTWKETSLHR